jgi:chromosome transmission fidelity protein 8
MPFKEIDYTSAHESLKEPSIITTVLGNAILEIQGELILPDEKPAGLTPEEDEKYSQLEGSEWAVKFGKLELEDKKATLFIGTTQRLLGEVKKLDPPLAILKFPNVPDTDDPIEMIDVIKYKIIFAGRPLPIM